jgi:hypothetical protein
MRPLFFLLLFGFSILSFGQKINGLSFVASKDSINPSHTNPVVKVNANYVALMPFGFIRDVSSPKIRFDTEGQWFGETDAGIRQYANEFRKRGIKIMVKPQIWIWHGKFTGHLEMTTEEDWKVLEDSYEEFILTYANTAKAVNADIFCIGTELEKFVLNRPDYWKELIQKIRKIYKGKLTYAANWDEFKRITFWNQLDYIGVDAYFPVCELETPTIQSLEAGWKSHKEAIQKVQSSFNKPVLFTEFGYRSVNYAGKEPWNSERMEGSVNLTAQANGLQAIYNQFWKEDWFAGGFIWKWFHRHDRVGGKNNNRFTPQNKPAEKLIQQLYGLH